MAFEVIKVKRLDANYVNIYYNVWHPNCKPCTLRKKITTYQTKDNITNEQATEIITKGLHLRTGGIQTLQGDNE